MFTYNSFPQAFRNQVFYILEDVLKLYHFDQEVLIIIREIYKVYYEGGQIYA